MLDTGTSVDAEEDDMAEELDTEEVRLFVDEVRSIMSSASSMMLNRTSSSNTGC